MSTFFIVSTPIGNLEDVTLRALRVLREVDVVVCEDTRVTGKLLAHLEIKKQLLSYNAHATEARHEQVIEMLREGKKVALVSDAGTPAISDPGSMLVSEVRKALGDEAKIEIIPGPSAVTAALALTGFPSSDFLFLGFLPHKKGRETLFAEISGSDRTVIFYESPHRIMKTLESLALKLDPARKIAICRELTKIYEECRVGSAPDILDHYLKNPDTVRGEFVVVVSAR